MKKALYVHRCQWLFKPGYQCNEAATWSGPMIMEDGRHATLHLCEIHRQDVPVTLKAAGLSDAFVQRAVHLFKKIQ